MPFFHLVILALVQGITEFLPISSSGNLVLAHEMMGKTVDDLTLDIAVHVGTLVAVLIYFRRDLVRMVCTFKKGGNKTLPFAIIVASLPVILAGYLLHLYGAEWTRSLALLAWSTLIFGIILGIADKFSPHEKTLEQLTLKNAFLIGLAQVLALIPGTSRSGITMTAARALGFSRTESARFSLFLAIVAISGAGMLTGLDLLKEQNSTLGLEALIAAFISFVSALAAISLMMRWLEKASFTPFVIYRILLGLLLLGLLYSGILESNGFAP